MSRILISTALPSPLLVTTPASSIWAAGGNADQNEDSLSSPAIGQAEHLNSLLSTRPSAESQSVIWPAPRVYHARAYRTASREQHPGSGPSLSLFGPNSLFSFRAFHLWYLQSANVPCDHCCQKKPRSQTSRDGRRRLETHIDLSWAQAARSWTIYIHPPYTRHIGDHSLKSGGHPPICRF